MLTLNDRCDCFILGSDQLHYPALYRDFDEFSDLEYIFSNKKKIAMASSTGRDQFNGSEYQRLRLSHALQRFDSISVREKAAVQTYHDQFGVECTWVLDPVFLCSRKYYDELADKAAPICCKPYIAAYVLDLSAEKLCFLQNLAENKQLSLYLILDAANQAVTGLTIPYDRITVVHAPSNETWIRAIRDCTFFITDSFHGSCFALIFQKQLLAFANERRGMERFKTLFGLLGIENRLLSQPSDISAMQDMDYMEICSKLEPEILRSQQWLRSALIKPHKAPLSEADLVRSDVGKSLCKVNQQLTNIDKSEANIWERIALLDQRFGSLEQRNVLGDQRFAAQEQRNVLGDQRFAAQEQRNVLSDQRFATQEQMNVLSDQRFAAQEQKFFELDCKITALEEKINSLEKIHVLFRFFRRNKEKKHDSEI